jgi:hypothetical protein
MLRAINVREAIVARPVRRITATKVPTPAVVSLSVKAADNDIPGLV